MRPLYGVGEHNTNLDMHVPSDSTLDWISPKFDELNEIE